MNALLILAHPVPNSLNHAFAQKARQSLEDCHVQVFYHDLYKEHFNPVLSHEELMRKASFDGGIAAYVDEVALCDLLLFVHPDWWGQPPAILKGWIDRVFQPGIAYEYQGEEFEAKKHVGLFNDKKMVVICTSNQSADEKQPVVKAVWEKSIFPFCAIGVGRCLLFCGVHQSSFAQRERWMNTVSDEVKQILST